MGRHPQEGNRRQHGPKRLTEADLGFRAFGLCPWVPLKLKLFGTFKASEVSRMRMPVKVASVSVECSHHACAKDIKLGAH